MENMKQNGEANPGDRIFYGWVIVAAGFLLGVVGIGARYCFGVFVKSIEIEFGMTRAATSGIFSMYMLLCVLFAIWGGWALDRYGPRKIGLMMGAFTGLSLVLTGRVNASWQLFLTYSLMLAMGTGAMYGVVNTTTSRWFVRKRGLVVGITSSGGGVGAIVLAPFATYLISNYDWRTAFTVMGVMAWIVIVALSLLLKKDPRDIGLLPDGAAPGPLPQEGLKGRENVRSNVVEGYSLGQVARMNQFWLLLCAWLFLSLSLHMIFIHVVPYAVDMGISPMDAALVLSLMGLTNIVGRLWLGRLSDVMGRKALGVVCGFLHFGTMLWLMGSSQLWMLYAFAVIFGILWGGSGTIITAMVGDLFGTRSLGGIMGVITAAWALGAAIGPAIGGYVFDVSGDYFIAFGTGAAALFGTACFVAMIKPISTMGD